MFRSADEGCGSSHPDSPRVGTRAWHGETLSDLFGDFSIDGLPPGSGAYTVEVSAPGYAAERREAVLGESRYVGVMQLRKG